MIAALAGAPGCKGPGTSCIHCQGACPSRRLRKTTVERGRRHSLASCARRRSVTRPPTLYARPGGRRQALGGKPCVVYLKGDGSRWVGKEQLEGNGARAEP
ncbi:unnamed protein product [Ectocarpus sp. 4 AP-2014]